MTSKAHPTPIFYHAADGLQLHYLFWPNSNSKSCCVLIHGFTNDAHIWDDLAQKLQKQHNVIAVDLRGHGDSAWDPEAKYTHPQMVDDVWQLMKNQTYSDWHIIGHSLGARVATLLIANHAIKPTTFTLIDTGPEVRAVGVNKVRFDAENTPTEFSSPNDFYKYLSSIYLFAQDDRILKMARYGIKENSNNRWIPKTDPAFTAALWKADSTKGNAQDLKYPLTDELWRALANIQCPTLILKGQASAILAKSVAEKMANEVMPNARLEIIGRAGHAMMVDNPDAFESTVCQFINKQ